MWVVLTEPDKKGNRWKREDFFATGQREIADVFGKLQKAGVTPLPGRVLDFGCGLGRLSQALATRFEAVDGVDISSSMIRQAKEFNQFPGRVNYHVNSRDDLANFPTASYDFVCSLIVLQHIPRAFRRITSVIFCACSSRRRGVFSNGSCARLAAIYSAFRRGFYPQTTQSRPAIHSTLRRADEACASSHCVRRR